MVKNKVINVEYTIKAEKDLGFVDSKQSNRIVNKILKETENDPLKNAKRLKGEFNGLYRYRIGNYKN